MKPTDHDLLVKLSVQVEQLIKDVKELKDTTTKRVDSLELEKLNIKDSYPVLYKEGVEAQLNDHEGRMRALEKVFESFMGKYAILAVIGMAGISIAISFIVKRF